MDKEFTYFIIDQSSETGSESPSKDSICFDDAKSYILETLCDKMVRAKKQDQVQIIGCHNESTENPLAIDGAFENVFVYNEMKHPTTELLRDILENCQINQNSSSEDADLTRAILLAIQLVSDRTNEGKKLSGKSTIVVLTNCESECDFSDEIKHGINNLISVLQIRLILVHSSRSDESLSYWKDFVECIKSDGAPEPLVISMQDGLDCLRTAKGHIPKLTRPVRVFDGEIRLGSDLAAIDKMKFSSDSQFMSKHDESYSQYSDPISLVIKAEGYPLTKVDRPVSSKNYGFSENDQVQPVAFAREHYVGAEPVEDASLMKSFKYGTSIVPITDQLSKMLKFPSFAGIDILGFVKRVELPVYFLMGEAILITPFGSSSTASKYGRPGTISDKIAFNALCESLIQTDSYCIARYVQKDGAEVCMAAMIPVYVDKKGTPSKKRARVEGEDLKIDTFAFSLIRLPFIEDLKFPNFPSLKGTSDSKDDKSGEVLPSHEMLSAMEEYIDAMDLDQNSDKKSDKTSDQISRHEHILSMPQYEGSLPIPSYQSDKLDPLSKLLISQTSPQSFIMSQFFKRLLLAGAESGQSLNDFVLKTNKGALERQIAEKSSDDKDLKPVASEIDDMIDSVREEITEPCFLDVDATRMEKLREKMAKLFDVQESKPEEKKPKQEESEYQEEQVEELPELSEILGEND